MTPFDFWNFFVISSNEHIAIHTDGFHFFNDDTVSLLNSLGVDYSFNVESRDIESDDIIYSKQFLPRFDCNEFLFGKAS